MHNEMSNGLLFSSGTTGICLKHKIACKKWNNAWLAENNDILVTHEAIRQWYRDCPEGTFCDTYVMLQVPSGAGDMQVI